MNKLKIELNNNIEIVNTNTISKLYNVTKSIPEPKEDEEDKAYLSGNLLVNKSYRSQVDYLMNRFKDLNINVGNYYIEFEDPEVLRVLLTNNIGDGIGVTTEEASTTAINLIFKNNTVIENFDEFKYFKGNYALYTTFSGCINLTSIIIPNSVTTIGYAAFTGSGLTSVTIPNSVTSLGGLAFNGCSGLTFIVVEKGNTKYDSRNNCNAIIETASNTLISGCKTTVIPNSVTTIGSFAFNGCSSLTSVTIPNSVTSIGNYAFRDCSDLTSVTIGNSVTSIGSMAFHYCSGLKKVIVPDIAAWCNISFGDTFANPLFYAKHIFSDENNEITDLVIPNSVTSIGNYAFRDCSDLTSITIPNSVTTIGSSAFYSCSGLKSVTIGNSVTNIGNFAFQNCIGLTSIEIPNSVTSIGSSVFSGCSKLTTIIIGNNVTNIGERAFAGTGISSIEIPNSVISIGKDAFALSRNLVSLTVRSITPPSLGDSFVLSNLLLSIFVPAESVDTYKQAEGWSIYADKIQAIPND